MLKAALPELVGVEGFGCSLCQFFHLALASDYSSGFQTYTMQCMHWQGKNVNRMTKVNKKLKI